MKLPIKSIAYNGVLAALYIVLTLLTYEISYLGIQFRIAEMLMFLCFFRKDSIIGLTLGCAISNILSFSPWDILFGTLATFISCLIIIFTKHMIFTVIIPTVLNAFVVGFELYWLLGEPFWFSCLTVAIGEFAVLMVGYIIFMIIGKRKGVLQAIGANQNLDFKF